MIKVVPFWGFGWWAPPSEAARWAAFSDIEGDPMPPPFEADMGDFDREGRSTGHVVSPAEMAGLFVLLDRRRNSDGREEYYAFLYNDRPPDLGGLDEALPAEGQVASGYAYVRS